MKYEILDQRDELTVRTKVHFTYDDGTEVDVDIPHFQPADQAEIEQGIANRYVSDLRNRLTDAKANNEVLDEAAVAELLTYDDSLETADALGVGQK